MADGYVDMLVLILIHQHRLAPLLSRFPLYHYGLALHSQLVSQSLLDLVLVQAVHIEECFRATDGGDVEDNAQVTGIAALVLVQDPVAVDKDDLRPEMRLVGLESLEQFQGRRQFSESQEARNVLFLKHNIEIIFIEDLLLLDTVDDQASTRSVFVPSGETDIHSRSQIELLRLPIEGIGHHDLAPHEGLLLGPSLSLFFGDLRPFLVVVSLHYNDLTKNYLL